MLFLAERDPRRQYPVYEHEFLLPAGACSRAPGSSRAAAGSCSAAARAASSTASTRTSSSLGGWNQPAFWTGAALGAGGAAGPVVLWVESTARDERSGNPLLERLKRRAVAAAAAFLVPGARGARVRRVARRRAGADRRRAERGRPLDLQRRRRPARPRRLHVPLRRPLLAGEGRRRARARVPRRARPARARGHRAARGAGARRWPTSASSSSATSRASGCRRCTRRPTASSCRRARRPGAWC